ncbi:exodeoxyribonuclease III [Actinacidiphila acididurans]|uniref:Exodeoxyribonuclease III n=1 Tax=Actinacidiphila acididurans TaxID=2784346 RepID=A0ABS2TUP4_9ACTN|nr:exodeoxyribonuclease III [Actinacidiphila acididurans]MBM9507058.1 exodeoxyribonuclease III [Actinacidiphila acididurans]
MLTVTSVNVNGLRAAAKKGFPRWLAETSADVVCLQEVRAEPDQLPAELRDPDGWHAYHAPAATKGRAGVSVYTRRKPSAVRVGIGAPEFDAAGRYLEVDLPFPGPGITVGSLYLPSGEAGTPRQDEKYRFMTGLAAHLAALHARAAADGTHALVTGDWNIAHTEADLKNWRANQKAAGFLPEERAWLTETFDTWTDVVRALHPDTTGPYTWWSYRGRAFDADSGWRIDYHVATPGLAKTAVTAVVERAASYDLRWSDHAPVTVTYDV